MRHNISRLKHTYPYRYVHAYNPMSMTVHPKFRILRCRRALLAKDLTGSCGVTAAGKPLATNYKRSFRRTLSPV